MYEQNKKSNKEIAIIKKKTTEIPEWKNSIFELKNSKRHFQK